MPRFKYKSRNSSGELVEGLLESETTAAVARQLATQGMIPVSIVEAGEKANIAVGLNGLFENKPDLKDLMMFSRQMYALSKSGVPIIRAIGGLIETTRNHMLREALLQIVRDLESGRTLAQAFGQHRDIFSTLFIGMLEVGEESGKLDQSFFYISRYLSKERETRYRIKGAFRYPLMVFVAIAVALGVINLFVIPTFAKVFESFHAELPIATKVLIATSNFCVEFWPHMLALAGVVAGGTYYYVQTLPGRYNWHRVQLRIPLIGSIIERTVLTRFARLFEMTLRSGVPLIQGLSLVSNALGNDFIGKKIGTMRTGIEKGDSLTRTARSTELFPSLVIQMLAVGEETGNVGDMLLEAADFYEGEIDADLESLSEAIEPLVLVIIGVLVLVMALGVFLPMWNLADVAQKA